MAAQIAVARELPSDLPSNLGQLQAWIEERTEIVGQQYRDYLAARKNGAPRRYFSCRAHALYFIKGVAPTKLVDGAWLYGLTRQWDDVAFHPLIKTYLEELGDGLPDKNHVTLYRKLLATHGCESWEDLGDDHFLQGALQLALGHHAEHFLPEVVGYNLGYEQLPLHLLITSYELNELGIDPYYFTLHVTVDNAASGHARKAVQAGRLESPGRLGVEILLRPGLEFVAGPQLAAVGADIDTVLGDLVEIGHPRVRRVVMPAVDEGVDLLRQFGIGGGVGGANQAQAQEAGGQEAFHEKSLR